MYQIEKNAILDFAFKTKCRLINKYNRQILKVYKKIQKKPVISKLFTNLSRRFIGGFLYSIKLEINDYCTLKCRMCYQRKTPGNGIDLEMSEIEKLFRDIRKYHVRLEILGGEPLLRKNILEIVEKTKTIARSPFVTLYTNGIHVTPDLSEQLKTAGLDAAIVTVISNNSKIHDEFTGVPGSWARTISGIKNLVNAGIKVYTFTAIHKENYRGYKQIYDFVKHELEAGVLFYQYVPQIKNDPLLIDNEIWHKIKHWLMYEKNQEHMKFVRNFYMLTGNACSGGNFVFTVRVNGEVQPCPFVYDIPLGNIKEDSIWKIVKQRYKNTDLLEFKKIPEECSDCSYRYVCAGGCKAGNRMLSGKYDTKDFRCLGPYNEPFNSHHVIDCVPTFF